MSKGLAFPTQDNIHYYYGLTKREYFAAKAMQGLCANSIPGSHHGYKQTANEAVSKLMH